MDPLGMLTLALERVSIDAFQSTVWLSVAVLVAALALLAWLRRVPRALGWSAWVEVEGAARGRPELGPGLATALRVLALASLALVLAGPLSDREHLPPPGLGLDLVVVLDASGSMRALDTETADRRRTRMDLARSVVTRFASQRVVAGDRVGLVVFGERAFTQCPLTSDGALLSSTLARVEVGVAGETTALGDALALAVERVAVSPEDPGLGAPQEALPKPGRLVVLLTDGRSNAGGIPVSVAVELARAAGVRVHTVGIGTGGARVPVAPRSTVGGGVRYERHDPDFDALREIARATGGRAFEARRTADLAVVYAEIDSIERRARPLEARRQTLPRPEPLLAMAGGLVLMEILLARLLRRRLPA